MNTCVKAATGVQPWYMALPTHLGDLWILCHPKTSACRLCGSAMQAGFACMCCCAAALYHYGTFLQRVPLIHLQIQTREMVPRHPSHLSSDHKENRKASLQPCRDFKGFNSLNICRNLWNSTYLIAPDLQVDLNSSPLIKSCDETDTTLKPGVWSMWEIELSTSINSYLHWRKHREDRQPGTDCKRQ